MFCIQKVSNNRKIMISPHAMREFWKVLCPTKKETNLNNEMYILLRISTQYFHVPA